LGFLLKRFMVCSKISASVTGKPEELASMSALQMIDVNQGKGEMGVDSALSLTRF
jgi:hypothetical protein